MLEKLDCKLGNTKYIILGVIVLCTLLLKYLFFDYRYVDYIGHLSIWIAKIQEGGGFVSLKEPFYNYTPLYLYVLVIIAKLEQLFGINTLYAIKVFSIFFEYILAFFVGKIACLYKKDEMYLWLSFIIVPLIPAVFIDSSLMSQCDSIYSSVIVASIYFLLKRKQLLSVLLLAVSFALKIQTAFILPLYFVYMLRGHIKWYYFLLIPFVYFVTILPVWCVGRPMGDLLTIYVAQSEYNTKLVNNFPNIYIWIDQILHPNKLIWTGVVALLVFLFGLELSRKKYTFTLTSWLKLAVLGALICPYLLPGMLDRYLYLADVLILLYAYMNRKNIAIALGVWFISLLSRGRSIYEYSLFPDGSESYALLDIMRFVPWKIGGVVFIAVIVYVAYDLFSEIRNNNKLKAKEFSGL